MKNADVVTSLWVHPTPTPEDQSPKPNLNPNPNPNPNLNPNQVTRQRASRKTREEPGQPQPRRTSRTPGSRTHGSRRRRRGWGERRRTSCWRRARRCRVGERRLKQKKRRQSRKGVSVLGCLMQLVVATFTAHTALDFSCVDMRARTHHVARARTSDL